MDHGDCFFCLHDSYGSLVMELRSSFSNVNFGKNYKVCVIPQPQPENQSKLHVRTYVSSELTEKSSCSLRYKYRTSTKRYYQALQLPGTWYLQRAKENSTCYFGRRRNCQFF